MVAGPDARVSCGRPAGIHSARAGGSTQVAASVTTVSTPLGAQASWWSSCVCQLKAAPAAIANVATIMAGPSALRCPSSATGWQDTRYPAPERLRSVADMNENHARLCPSPEWARWMQGELLPALAAGVDLGAEMLEVGPGPGAATEWLRHRVRRLVCLEIDQEAAARLAAKHDGGNVEVAVGDAAA